MIKRRIISAFIALVLIISALPAIAVAESQTMYVAVNVLQSYYSWSQLSEKYALLPYGTEVTVLKTSELWARLENPDGPYIYVQKRFLTSKNPNVAPVACYCKADGVKVYSLPSETDGEVLTKINYGAKVNGVALTTDKKWLRIEQDGEYAYVKAEDFSLYSNSTETNVYVGVNVTTLRKTASVAGASNGSAYFGEEFMMREISGDWAYITNGIVSGWTPAESLQSAPVAGKKTTYSVNSYNTKLYARSGKSLSVFDTLEYGQLVDVVAITPDREFAMVEYEETYGYIYMNELNKLDLPESEIPGLDGDDEEITGEIYAYVVVEKTPAYESATTSSKRVGTVYYGEKLKIEKVSNDWIYITNAVGSGWIQSAAVSLTDPIKDSTEGSEKIYASVVSDSAPAFEAADGFSKRIGTVYKGEQLEIIEVKGDWAHVKNSKGDGWVLRYDLTFINIDDEGNAQYDVVYVMESKVPAYQSATELSQKIGHVYYGEMLYLVKVEGDWAQIKNNSGTGWIMKSALSTQNPEDVPNNDVTDLYVTAQSAPAYAEATTTSKRIGTVYYGEQVRLIKTKDDWAYIRNAVGEGWVKRSALGAYLPDTDASDGSITVYVTANVATAYKNSSASSGKIGTVSFGEVLTCTEVKGSWAKVSNSAGEGWVQKSALSTTNPAKLSQSYYCVVSRTYLYARPVSGANTKAYIEMKDSVTVRGTTSDGEWYLVEYGNKYGYVKTTEFAASKPSDKDTVYIKDNFTTVYQNASSSSKVITEVYYGQDYIRMSTSNEWTLIANSAGQGWVKTSALTTVNPNKSGSVLYITTDDAVVRKKPASDGKKVTTLDKGDIVTGVAITPDEKWVRIKYNGGYAYMSTNDISVKGQSEYEDPCPGTANDTIEKVVALAIEQYGKPYVYAEEGPDTYDCSGLMQYCYQKGAGIKLLRSAHDQGYDERFTHIQSVSELKRGDVLVFDTIDDGDDLSDHTGLYLGDGKFIHASSSAGKVIVSDVSSGYYARKFSWALRVIGD